jgi:hypothetical protein
MYDGHESILARMFILPMMKAAGLNYSRCFIGFRKHENDPGRLYSILRGFDWYVSVDFKEFDSSMGPKF